MTTTVADTSYSTDYNLTLPDADLTWVGIEFEYPVAAEPKMAPATTALRSEDLRDEARGSRASLNEWDLTGYDDGGAPTGTAGRDHTGAEIQTDILDLHSDQPEKWYRATIERAEDMGHPFAACAVGATNFGLHMHVSNMTDEQAYAVREHVTEPWAPTFFCASITPTSLDPWRNGGVGASYFSDPGHGGRSSITNHYGDQHYELRLFEPGVPEHVDLMLRYLRLLETNGPDAARDFARELVYTADRRLTPVQQATLYAERLDNWPNEECFMSREDYQRSDQYHYEGRTDRVNPGHAEWFFENVFEPHIA